MPKPRLTYLIKQVESAIRSELDQIARTLGITIQQYTALSVLDGHPGMSSAQLARRSFVSAQAAHEMILALDRKGLVERRAQPDNRRVLALHLTKSGAKVLRQCDAKVDELESRLLTVVSPAAASQLRASLDAFAIALRPPDVLRPVRALKQ